MSHSRVNHSILIISKNPSDHCDIDDQ
jgi:hypothetical protein